MAVNDVLAQLQQLIQGAAPRLIQVGDSAREPIPFIPGERYVAKVLEQLQADRFLVQIRDQKLDLNLPRTTQPGANIELRFVTAQPRLTFVQAEAVTPNPNPAVNLNDSARYLNALLDRVKDLAARQQLPAATSHAQQVAKPVVEGALPATPQLAAMLKSNISQSGLFYESHQAQWALGQRPLTELLREPQGKLSDPRAFQAAQLASQPGQLGQPPRVEVAQANVLQQAAHIAAAATQEPVHPQSAPLVQQQLEVLDQRQIMWQGLIWPGQEMRWEIEEHAGGSTDSEDAQEWQTRLDLRLPNLGELNALLSIGPHGIRIDVKAHETDTVAKLQLAHADLHENMTRVGLRLIDMTVTENDGSGST